MKERQAGHLLLLRPLRAALRGARRLAVGENQSMATVWSFPAVLASLAGSCLPLSSASVSGPAELTLAESEGEPGRWVVRSAGTARPLLEIVPDAWSGNANVYAPGGTIRVGHFWSQLLMFSGGNWLTDRVESEGFRLISFEVLGAMARASATGARGSSGTTSRARPSISSGSEAARCFIT